MLAPRIIYFEPKWGNNTYPDYFGVLNELMNLDLDVQLVTSPIRSISELDDFVLKPSDALIFGYGWFGEGHLHHVEGLDQLSNKKIIFFHKPFNNLTEKINFVKNNNFDLLLSSTPGIKKLSDQTGIKSKLFSYGCDSRVFGLHPNRKKKYDVGFSGAFHDKAHFPGVEFSSPDLRSRAQLKLKKYYGNSKFLNGSDKMFFRIRSTKRYALKLQQSKLWISTTGPMLDLSSRYFEAGISKAVPLTDKIPEDYTEIFKDNENVIVFDTDCQNILDKVANAVEDYRHLEEMANYARSEILEKHTYIRRAKELIEFVERITK